MTQGPNDKADQEASKENDTFKWPPQAVRRMLELYREDKFLKRFKDRVTKKKCIWMEIVTILNDEFHIKITADQCCTKFRNL